MCFNCGLKRLSFAILTEVFYQQLLETNPKVSRETFVDVMTMNSVHRMMQEIEMAALIEGHVDQLVASARKGSKRQLN